MSGRKYTYSVEAFSGGEWYAVIRAEGRDFCLGYFLAHRDMPPPHAEMRIVRSDGKVIDHREANDRVALGMVAGFPTPEAYERAAQVALDKAAHLRAMEESQRERRDRARQLRELER